MCFLLTRFYIAPERSWSFGGVRLPQENGAGVKSTGKSNRRPWLFTPWPSTLGLSLMRPPHFRMNCLAALTWLLLLLLVPAVEGQSPALITLDEAIDLALGHNHSLKATRTLILQNQAQEITANLRPNPTFNFDSQFLPIFSPSDFSSNNLSEVQQFDTGIGYLFERGHKRQRRLQAARDQTAVTRAQI